MPPNSKASSWLRASLCALLLGTGGCASMQTGANQRFAVSAAKTQFFKYGPAQAYGADASLPKGQKVTMVKREFGFSQVRLEDGTTGFVATEDLVQLPPEPKLAALASHRRTRSPEPERQLDLTDTPTPSLPQ
jgi:uncharacterized protein YgiM (DUF1202 family)